MPGTSSTLLDCHRNIIPVDTTSLSAIFCLASSSHRSGIIFHPFPPPSSMYKQLRRLHQGAKQRPCTATGLHGNLLRRVVSAGLHGQPVTGCQTPQASRAKGASMTVCHAQRRKAADTRGRYSCPPDSRCLRCPAGRRRKTCWPHGATSACSEGSLTRGRCGPKFEEDGHVPDRKAQLRIRHELTCFNRSSWGHETHEKDCKKTVDGHWCPHCRQARTRRCPQERRRARAGAR